MAARPRHQKNNGLENLQVNMVALDPSDPNTLYAATDGGTYISFNGGDSWGLVNNGLLGATVVYSIVIDAQSNVYASTPYGNLKSGREIITEHG